jgi:D-3-phosphoglycerate dehydrogenase
MMNKAVIKQCKKGSILINYARGEVVDLEALKAAIESGHISGAAIDVFPVEPEKSGDAFTTPLQHLPNVILTPHIGGMCSDALNHCNKFIARKIQLALNK